MPSINTPLTNVDADVLILGAGMAGLSAALDLTRAGKRVLIVEARDRIGGRIFTEHIGSESLELGAEFVHGKPPELWQLIEEANLSTYELDGEQLCFDGHTLGDCGQEPDAAFSYLESLKDWHEADCTFAEYLDRAEVPAEVRRRLIGYVEGFNAADHRVIGVASLARQQAAEDEIEGDRLFRIRGGYDQLPQYLLGQIKAAGGQIALETQVMAVRWANGSVEFDCLAGIAQLTLRASQAVITLPLGVLNARSVEFSPQPEAILRSASTMRMGHVSRHVLLFETPFWQELDAGKFSPEVESKLKQLGFLFASELISPVWWTQFPEPSTTITAWTGGPRSEQLNTPASDQTQELIQHLIQVLAKIFTIRSEEISSRLVHAESHNWQYDPFCLGAYSYVPAGAVEASTQMAQPVHDTLFFAGEHTDTTGHWGTVHGAFRSGVRAASQLLATRKL